MSCLLNRPFAPSRQTLRFKSTETVGVYPTPDHSVAALLWSQQKESAKAAKRKAGPKGQIEPGKVVASKPASAAKTKAKSDERGKVSKASSRQQKGPQVETRVKEYETILSVPKLSTVKKGPPRRKNPISLKESLRDKLAQVKAVFSLQTSEASSHKDELLGQTPKGEDEQTAGLDDTVISGQEKVGSRVKVAKQSEMDAKRLKKASDYESKILAEDMKEALAAQASAHDSRSVEDPAVKKRNSPTAKPEDSQALAAISPRIKKLPSNSLIRKLATAGGDVARKVRSTRDLNAEIRKTEAALERRDQKLRRESKLERLAQARQASQKASAEREHRPKSIKKSGMDGAKSIRKALERKRGGNAQSTVGTNIQTINAAELDIARM